MEFDAKELDGKILSDKYNALIFGKKRGREIYIVGGYIRDILLRRTSADRDYVVEGPLKDLIKEVASESKGKIITIGEKDFYRIILNNGVTLDFSPIKNNIESDISERDFTINSLAWSPERGIIDLSKGLDDISNKLIKMIKMENLRNDPVRILRAYRLAGELSFRIDGKTRNALKLLSFLIREVKSERITLEFFKILNSKSRITTLEWLLEDGILECIIFLSHRELEHRVKVISEIYPILHKLPLRYQIGLENIFSQDLSGKGLLGLEILMEGSPENLLNISSKVMKNLIRLGKASKYIAGRGKIAKEMLFYIFDTAGESSPDFLIINNSIGFLCDFERFSGIMKEGLLSTDEIIEIIKISKGRSLGRYIRMLKKAQFENKIRDNEGARTYLKNNLPRDLI